MELQVKELRIGNCINEEYGGHTDIHIVDVDILKSLVDGSEVFWEPIPLIEDWLVKFGYKYSSTLFDSKIYRKGIYFVSILKDNIVFGIKEDAASKYLPLVRRSNFSVHLLQNLHYDLGEELILNNN